MATKRRIRKRDNRTQYIVVFQDLYNVNRYGGLIRAMSYENAEFMASCICGIIIGEIDPNIYVATGHEGSGHSLATITAKILSSYFFTNEYSHYQNIVSPDRFNV